MMQHRYDTSRRLLAKRTEVTVTFTSASTTNHGRQLAVRRAGPPLCSHREKIHAGVKLWLVGEVHVLRQQDRARKPGIDGFDVRLFDAPLLEITGKKQ